MTEFDHPDRSGQIGSNFDELKRNPQEDTNRARQAAEALFAPKSRVNAPAASLAGAANAQTTRKPRILSAAPATTFSIKPDSSSLKVTSATKSGRIPSAHFALIRTWLKYGMNISQVAELYGVPVGEIEGILKKE